MEDNTATSTTASTREIARTTVKKKRVRGACDICKRKKIRCDSGQLMGPCTNCIQGSYECTHLELSKNLGAAKGYVDHLEQKLQKIQALVSKFLPGVDLNQVDEDFPEELDDSSSKVPRNDDDDATESLAIKLNKLKLDPSSRRFYDKASEYYLIQALMNERAHSVGCDEASTSETWHRRPEFWTVRPWQAHRTEIPWQAQYSFPPDDLIPNLVDLYFQEVNMHLPLLHRPTFERCVAERLHMSDSVFAGTLLLVCALGARYSDDSRIFLDGNDGTHTAGWKWFDQVPVLRTSLVQRATLYELQMHVLSIVYTLSTSLTQGDWVQVGFALRLAQDVGAHRRKTSDRPNTNDELWKRAFWCLVCLDRFLSGFSGRPSTLHDEDFDLQYPLEVDDEYWDHPDPQQSFNQPAGKPAQVTAFVNLLKLMGILGLALKTIYGIRKPTRQGPALSMQQIIADLDSDMNRWLDSLPEHLQWDPVRPEQDFFRQSSYLFGIFWWLQILIHRPFIPTPQAHSSLSFSSLAICTQAARSIAHIVETPGWRNFGLLSPLPHLQNAVYAAGVVLLLSTWTNRGSRSPASINEDLVHVYACLDHLKACEDRWNDAGFQWDVLSALTRAGDTAHPKFDPLPRKKRRRDEGETFYGGQATNTANTLHRAPGYVAVERVLQDVNYCHRSKFVPPVDIPNDFSDGLPLRDMSTSPTIETAISNDEFLGGYPSSSDLQSSIDADAAFSSAFASEMDATLMWTAAPSGYQLDDWGPYIDSFNQMTHGSAEHIYHDVPATYSVGEERRPFY